MKKTKAALWMFVIVGVLLLVSAVFVYSQRVTELSTMIPADGTVVVLSERGCLTVQFKTFENRSVRFGGNVCQRPPAYDLGQGVPVLYSPQNPNKAYIDDFTHKWFLSTAIGGLALGFLGIGGVFVWTVTLNGWRAERRINRLKVTGRQLNALLMGAERDESINLNGQNPWRIVAQWLDPNTNQVRLFYSKHFWFDPSPYLKGKHIQVWIDPQRPQHYCIDTDILPKLT